MKTLDYVLAFAYVVVNIFSLVQVFGSYRWPTVTRVVFFLIFGIAAFVNTKTVLATPWVYESYAYYAIPFTADLSWGRLGQSRSPWCWASPPGRCSLPCPCS